MALGKLAIRIWQIVLVAFAVMPLSAAMAQSSQIVGWGRNDYGQASSLWLTNAVDLSAGIYHSVALRSNGTVYAWGRDNFGQLNIPTVVRSGVIAIACGDDHTLALRTNGLVVAWGRNTLGRTNVPPTLSNVVAIAAGDNFSLALRENGTIVGWGYNGNSQTTVPLGMGFVGIAAGGSHGLAIRANGTVDSWGANDSGQRAVPMGLSNVVAVAAGDDHSLALQSNGRVVAWGRTNNGMISVAQGLSGVVGIAADSSHSQALLADGTVVSWGSNASGQTNTPAGLGGVTAIAAGSGHALALVGGTAPRFAPAVSAREVLAGSTVLFSVPLTGELPLSIQWQLNGTNLPSATNRFLVLTNVQMGQAGNYRIRATNIWGSTMSPEIELSVVPFRILSHPPSRTALLRGDSTFAVQVEGQGPFAFQWLHNGNPLSLGANSNLTLTNLQWSDSGNYSVHVSNVHGSITSLEATLSLSQIAAWGSNDRGQTSLPAGLSNILLVASGSSHTLALRRNGTVTTWGKYENSQNPVQAPFGLSNVVGIAAGNSFSAALKSDGTVVAWSDYSTPATNVPAGLSNVVSISAGADNAMALQADGTLVTWGNSVAAPNDLYNIVQIASGRAHFFALRADGNVVAWGNNSYGQTNVPFWLSNVVTVAGSAYHSVAAQADGRVVAWGGNDSGQSSVPPGISNVVGVAAGDLHSAARRGDGTVAVWGSGSLGISNVPPDLRDVAGIAAGSLFITAIVGDGPPWFAPSTVQYNGLATTDAILHVPVTGEIPIAYQWQWYGTNVPDATNTSLRLRNLQMNQGGHYRLMASNSSGTATSPEILMTVSPLRIRSHPQDVTIVSGQSASFSSSFDGAGPFTCQWLHEGQPLPFGTNPVLNISNSKWTAAGRYSVTVSNAFGSATSSQAQLNVIPVVAWGNGEFVSTVPKDLTNAVAIAAGGERVFAARRDGTLVSWNASGSTHAYPNATSTVAVAAGELGYLALQADGTVEGWPGGGATNVVAVSAKMNHFLALTGEGRVLVTRSDPIKPASVPTWSDRIVAVAAGNHHVLALRDDGRVVVWGEDHSLPASPPPADLTDVIAIATDADHSLAIRADGRVVSWGWTNPTGPMNVPTSLSNVVAVSAGPMHCLALRSDGTTVVWGYGGQGQTNMPAWLGSDGVSIASSHFINVVLQGNGPPFVPPVVGSRSGVRGLTTHLFVTATGGRPLAYQWQFDGTNLPGATSPLLSLTNLAPNQAGNYRLVASNAWGTSTSSDIHLGVAPLRVIFPPQATNTHLFGGVSLSAIIEGESPFTYQWLFDGAPLPGQTNAMLSLSSLDWKDQGSYSLRIGNVHGSVTSAAAMVRLSPLVSPFEYEYLQNRFPSGVRDIVAVTTGGDCILALRADQTVLAWGINNFGQTNVPFGLNNVVAVATSLTHCLAVRADGTVVAWGRNNAGQTNVPAGLNNVVAVAAGSMHSLGLRADGTVVAWGAGSVGGQSHVPTDLSNVVAVAAGEAQSLALKADGTVVAWGTYWRDEGGYAPMYVPTGLTNIVALGAGANNCLAVKSDGYVVAWGATFDNQSLVPLDLTNAVAVSGGNWNNSLALRNDNTVVGWGGGIYGSRLDPEMTNIVAIAEGGWVALLGDGAPYLPPAVTDRSGPAGSTVHLNLRATGVRPMSYQWFLNGTPLSSATNALLSLRDLNPRLTGNYSLRATNSAGSVTVSNLNVRLAGFWLGAEPSPDPAQFNLGVFGPTDSRCAVLVSSNLSNWAELRRLTNNGQIQIVTDNKAGESQRFYRLMTY